MEKETLFMEGEEIEIQILTETPKKCFNLNKTQCWAMPYTPKFQDGTCGVSIQVHSGSSPDLTILDFAWHIWSLSLSHHQANTSLSVLWPATIPGQLKQT